MAAIGSSVSDAPRRAAASPLRGLALPLMVLLGLGMMLQIVASNTFLQTAVDDDKRGRIMSLYTMAFLGMTPFGSLLAGKLTDAWGIAPTLLLGGTCCAAGALLFASRLAALRPLVRAVYARKGLMPGEAAAGYVDATAPTSAVES